MTIPPFGQAMSYSRKKGVLAEAKVDNQKDIQNPLDYSFKTITSFEELLREKQRPRNTNGAISLEDEVADEGSELSLNIVPSESTALKVNNNMLSNWIDFQSTIERIFVDPAKTLSWLDLSFNDLRTIDEALLCLPNLMILYFHGNNIFPISEVDKLVSLPKLKTLTLHGNPVEVYPGYRSYVVTLLPQLHTLDFSGVTKSERAIAASWTSMNMGRRTKKSKQ